MTSELKSKFKKLGLKLTRQRKAILDALESVDRPVSVEQLKVLTGTRKIDLVTFYRNIKLLVGAKLVNRIEFMRGHALYERADLGDHHHLICTGCKRVEDVKNCNVDSLSRRAVSKSRNFKAVTSHSLELFGLCKTCAKL